MAVYDTFGRGLGNLRLSVTDRCNLRCAYCMPESDYVWLPGEEILTFEELSALVDRFIANFEQFEEHVDEGVRQAAPKAA